MLDYRPDRPIAWLTINRPEKLNALASSVWAELRERLAEAEADDGLRVIILHGAGPCFSVGGDIEGLGEIAGPGERRAYITDAMAAYRALESCSKPIIAAVHGHVLGGGCELTIFADVVIADTTARFGTPEARLGLVPGPAMARGLAHANLHWMKLMVLAGEVLDADEARLAGLVNRVVPEGKRLEAAEALAQKMARNAPLALAIGKQLLNHLAPEALAEAALAVNFLQGTDDHAAGVAAFAARREPSFRGT